MAQFKVKNLMVDIVSAKTAEVAGDYCLYPSRVCPNFTLQCKQNTFACPGNTLICRDPTKFGCYRGSCFVSHGCGVNYSTCMDTQLWVIDMERLVINPDDIKVVQAQLNDALKALGDRAQEVARDMAPQTVAQAEMLETELKAALDEVQAAKKKLAR